ncbi:MAG: ABC transporter ATP-binding protein, partial [Planctomycetes bacterium]|nr:ABC transporter ATP-binding protein [Planctomycetota bacterium]
MGQTEVHALKPTNLSFDKGVFTAIMGPSGSGKSTMLNLLGMLDRPSAGQYVLEGKDVANLDDNALSEIRCSRIGIIFQSFNLFPNYTILENVCVPMRYNEMLNDREMHERAAMLLDRVGLGDRVGHTPTELSGGQCQRVAIARSLANDPAFLLA